MAVARSFQAKLYDAGLAGLDVPREFGGQGLDGEHARIWREEASHFPLMTEELSISLGNCLPVIIEFGTPEQRQTHVAAALSGRHVFCQLFSEPEAGSDVAAVRSRAERDGDGWRLSGQKVWTTLAHVADYGIVLARTDTEASKHGGLSMFIVDFKSPGVDIRPIHQIDGGMHFNEVFFDEVELGPETLIPPEHEGWMLASAMLRYQRVARGTGQSSGIQHDMADRLIAESKRHGNNDDPRLRQDLIGLYIAEVCRSLLAMRTRADLDAGRPPGPAGSLPKLAGAMAGARYRDLCLRVVGPSSVAWDEATGGKWARDSLFAVSLSISGGTSEIQRNIIGERVLGLPREPAIG